MKTKQPVSPLLRILKFWELVMWLLDLRKIAAQALLKNDNGALKTLSLPKRNWRHFREYLTKIHVEGFAWDDWSTEPTEEYWKIVENKGVPREKGLSYLFKTPAILASWTLSSRRTFKLDGNLQVQLAATSLKGVDWAKFNWPFNSFLIELEVPLIINRKEFDAIMISNEDQFLGHNRMTVKLIPKLLFSRDEIGHERREALTHLAKHNVRKFKPTFLSYFLACIDEAAAIDIDLWDKVEEDAFRTGDISSFDELPHDHKIVFRILFGLILFLQTREGQQSKFGPREEHAAPLPGNDQLITDGEEVCYIGSGMTLSHEEYHRFLEAMDGIGTEQSCAFIMGHWRRPPGSGHDPLAEKTVWVRPYITHKEKLHLGLPVGASTQVVSV